MVQQSVGKMDVVNLKLLVKERYYGNIQHEFHVKENQTSYLKKTKMKENLVRVGDKIQI